ncbi:MAG: ComF family protein [Methylococcaceae bacterium]|jgi:ComF family protein
MVYNWMNIIQQYLLPPTCILCGNDGWRDLDLCADCYKQLQQNNYCCVQCAQPFSGTQADLLCGRCLHKQPAFDKVYAPYLYVDGIRHLVTTFKFNKQYKNARILGNLLAEHLINTAELPDCIISVPLHNKRYYQRGFNQAIEIAKIVAKRVDRPLNLKACVRQRDTPHQTGQTAKQRQKNLKNAFKMCQKLDAKHVAIIDDVMTTGSTIHELAALLKNHGVDRVDAWVCARA